MKRFLALIMLAVLLCTLSGCGKTAEAVTDYGSSEIYTKWDMDTAIFRIRLEFLTWDGCIMHSITYGGDESCTEKELAWLNGIDKARGGAGNFTECILFRSDFLSTGTADGSMEPGFEYTDWQWWLARSENGAWHLIDWGY